MEKVARLDFALAVLETGELQDSGFGWEALGLGATRVISLAMWDRQVLNWV